MPNKDQEAVILSGARTPSGRFLGSLSSIPAPRLGSVAVKAAAFTKYGDSADSGLCNARRLDVQQIAGSHGRIHAGTQSTKAGFPQLRQQL